MLGQSSRFIFTALAPVLCFFIPDHTFKFTSRANDGLKHLLLSLLKSQTGVGSSGKVRR